MALPNETLSLSLLFTIASSYPPRALTSLAYAVGLTPPNIINIITTGRGNEVTKICLVDAFRQEKQLWSGKNTGLQGLSQLHNVVMNRCF